MYSLDVVAVKTHFLQTLNNRQTKWKQLYDHYNVVRPPE